MYIYIACMRCIYILYIYYIYITYTPTYAAGSKGVVNTCVCGAGYYMNEAYLCTACPLHSTSPGDTYGTRLGLFALFM